MNFRHLTLLASTIVLLTETATIAQIIPTGATQVQQSGMQFNIQGGNVSGDGRNLFHNFQQFNLTREQIANFESNPAIRNIFSRISSSESSVINGLLQISGGNSNLYLINPSGILFGRDVRLNLPAAFNASTATEVRFGSGILGTTDYAKLIGDPTSFQFTALQSGAIVNSGQLSVSNGQTLSLFGSSVINTGSITAPGGNITIAAIPGTSLIKLSHANNVMSLEFQPFGTALSTPSKLPQLLAGRNIQNAQAIELTPEGQVKLTGSGLTLPEQTGVAAISGTINVSSAQSGGTVKIIGNQIALSNATVNATGNTQGGTVLIGGDYQGKGPLPNASQTLVDQQSTIDISANLNGNAGKAVIWSDQSTGFGGFVRGNGGIQGGNGGLVEVSGKENLYFQGNVKLGTTAGTPGTLLLDPTDITITDQRAQLGFNLTDFNTINGPATIAIGNLQILSQNADVTLLASNSIKFANPNNYLYLGGLRLLTLNAPTIKIGGFNALALSLIGNRIETGDLDVGLLTINGTISVKTESIRATTTTIDAPIINTKGIQSTTIALTAANNINIAGPIESPWLDGQVNLTSQFGSITTQDIRSRSNPIVLTANAGNITTGLLYTTPINANDPGADVTLLSGGNIKTGPIVTDGTWDNNFLSGAGNITLKTIPNTQSSITVAGGIRSRSNNGSGNVTIDSDQVTIGKGDYVGPLSQNPSETQVNIWSSGQVNITHGGGINNLPLTIATSSPYRADAIPNDQSNNIGFTPKTERLLNPNSQNPSNVTIVNRNQAPTIAPTLSPTDTFTPGETRTFTLRSLGVTAQDLENDNLHFLLRVNPNNPGSQIYLKSTGESLNQTRTAISLDDEIVYQAPADRPVQGKVLDILVSDLPIDRGILQPLSGKAIWNQALQLVPGSIATLTTRTTPIPPTIPITLPQNNSSNPIPNPPPNTVPNSPIPDSPNISFPQLNPEAVPSESIDAEKAFTQDFAQSLGQEKYMGHSINDARGLTQQIAGVTGIKPALIYLNFIPATARSTTATVTNQDEDLLEITLITAKGIRHKRLTSVQRSEVLRTAQAFRREITNPIKTHTTSYLPSAQQLYQWIIKPIENDLQEENISNLVFLPDAGLRSIPYAALHSGQGFLIDRFSVGIMPSLSLTDVSYRDLRNESLLTLGISAETQGQPPLPNVTNELSALQTLWSNQRQLYNQQATLSNFQGARTQTPFKILHLATHGNFAAGDRSNAYIQLWNDRLKLDQIRTLGWNNPPIELLILSACKTAVGDRESELGFAGIAAQTGVKSTIASLWSVNDSATTALMSKLYESLKQSPIKAEALRQAQLSLAQGKVKIIDNQLTGLTTPGLFPMESHSGDANFIHPYYWSAFTLVGNPW